MQAIIRYNGITIRAAQRDGGFIPERKGWRLESAALVNQEHNDHAILMDRPWDTGDIVLTPEQALAIREAVATATPAEYGKPYEMTANAPKAPAGVRVEYLGGGGEDEQERIVLPRYRWVLKEASEVVIDLDGAQFPAWLAYMVEQDAHDRARLAAERPLTVHLHRDTREVRDTPDTGYGHISATEPLSVHLAPGVDFGQTPYYEWRFFRAGEEAGKKLDDALTAGWVRI